MLSCPLLSLGCVGFVFAVYGVILADLTATSRIESKTWIDPISSWTLVRNFSAFDSRYFGSFLDQILDATHCHDCICPSMVVSVAVVGSVCVVGV